LFGRVMGCRCGDYLPHDIQMHPHIKEAHCVAFQARRMNPPAPLMVRLRS
jgi:hypothetical protein